MISLYVQSYYVETQKQAARFALFSHRSGLGTNVSLKTAAILT
jgi:hypothetical protein